MSTGMGHARKGGRECVRQPAVTSGARQVTQCDASGAVLLWDRNTLLMYPGGRLSEPPVTMTADFCIRQVVLSSSCAACVDSNGVAHTISLKFKTNIENTIKIPFKPRAQGLLSCSQINADVVSALLRDRDLYLTTYKIQADFKLVDKYRLEVKTQQCCATDFQENLILKSFPGIVNKDIARKVFKKELENDDDQGIFVSFSFDCLTLYGLVVSLDTSKSCRKSISPIKLFTTPTEISTVEAINRNKFNILIGLKTGTVVILSCNEEKFLAKLIHLNAAIHKIVPLNEDRFIYTDGIKMWQADNVLSDQRLNVKQLFVTQPRDFIRYGDRVLCTTYTNLIYSFCIMSNDIYINEASASEGFLTVPGDLASSKLIVTDIMSEVKRNEQILQKIKIENTLMTAVALSRNTLVLDKHILFTTHLFDKYEDVLQEHASVTLTGHLKEYFEPSNVSLLVKLKTSSEFRQKFNEICLCLSRNFQLHIEVSQLNHCETTTVPLGNRTLESMCFLIPVKIHGTSAQISITTKIVAAISGPVDVTQVFWTILYSKQTALTSEHFIKVDGNCFNNEIATRRTTENDLAETVISIAKRNHGLLYDIQIAQKTSSPRQRSCFLQLPKEYPQRFSDINSYTKTLNNEVSKFLLKKFGSNDFLMGKQTVYITVHCIKVAFHIMTEESNILQITGSGADIVWDLRQFISSIFYNTSNVPVEMQLIPQIEYTRIENLRRKLHDIQSKGTNEAAILDVTHQFHRYTLGVLPL